MKLRAPALPLITVDPYFSIWSEGDALNFTPTVHWTGKKNEIVGSVTVDGETETFLGYDRKVKKMCETYRDYDALNTRVTMENEKIRLSVRFMTPLLPENPALLSRPVSYMVVSYESKDKRPHEVTLTLSVNTTLCKNNPLDDDGVTVTFPKIDGLATVKMGNTVQKPLSESGDDIRINWGHFLCAVRDTAAVWEQVPAGLWRAPDAYRVSSTVAEGEERLFLFAYDDLFSIDYFGTFLKSLWNKDGKTIEEVMAEAVADYPACQDAADAFSDELTAKAYLAGGEKYADICSLAYRQVIAAHKLAVAPDGSLLWISKECFSNGCAATVDVSYPSIPLFLLYNPELVKGMLRPIYHYVESGAWNYDFAPHDVGRFPILHGQVYGLDCEGKMRDSFQMPVEECGNMIIMETNIALAERDASFAKGHYDTLKQWAEYLIRFGDDPEDQLCTDDFAGHLAHNCNLALKAILGIAGMGILAGMLGDTDAAARYRALAKEKADGFMKRAANGDGSTRLAFDRPNTYSMKYNMVWDKIWGTGLFPADFVREELETLLSHTNRYGLPLDNRADYTKSDWLVWTATLSDSRAMFAKFIAPMWRAYNESDSRVPLTDWYDTLSGLEVGFQHRSVQGGLFIKMLADDGKLHL